MTELRISKLPTYLIGFTCEDQVRRSSITRDLNLVEGGPYTVYTLAGQEYLLIYHLRLDGALKFNHL